jgi:hypothetical protein
MRTAMAMVLLLAPAAKADEEPVAAARARQERAKTLQALVRHTSVVPAGGYSKSRPHIHKGKPSLPAKEIVLTAVNRLILTGDRALAEDTVRAWHPTDPPMNRRVNIWDGTKALMFLPEGINARHPAPVAVYRDDWFTLPHDLPLLLAFRPMDRVVQPWVTMNRLTATGRVVEVDGEPCVEHEVREGANTVRRLLLSPRREYLPVLIQQVDRGVVGSSTKVAYQQYAKNAWAPVRWVTDRPGDDGVASRTAEVLSMRINEPLDRSILTPVFRPGTTIHDYVRGANKEYLVDGTGAWRPVAGPVAAAPLWRRAPPWAWGAVLGLILFALLAAWYLDRLTPRSSPPR